MSEDESYSERLANEAEGIEEFLALLRASPSLSPGTAAHLLEVKDRTRESFDQHAGELHEKDRFLVRTYLEALEVVTLFGAVHQAIVVKDLETLLGGVDK